MTNEHIDPIYKHVDDYIDDKLKIIKRELQTLKQAHDAVAAQQSQSLLETQRFMARLSIRYVSSNVVTAARRQNSRIVQEVFTQLTADVAAARAQADASKEPLVVARQFGEKCDERAEKWGLKFIELS